MSSDMVMFSLFSWWYHAGWAGVLVANRRRLSGLSDMFSITILLRTLFAPWKRIITYPGAGLDARIKAFGDNLVSRMVGFTVRFFVLLAAGISFTIAIAAAGIEIICWPLLPIAGIGFIIWGAL
jgi:hypothetical protein